MPSLDILSTKGMNILIYPINLEKPNKEKTSKFFKDLNITNLKIYFDSDFSIAKKFKLRGVPTTILLNQKGEEFARIIGDIDFSKKEFLNWLKKFT